MLNDDVTWLDLVEWWCHRSVVVVVVLQNMLLIGVVMVTTLLLLSRQLFVTGATNECADVRLQFWRTSSSDTSNRTYQCIYLFANLFSLPSSHWYILAKINGMHYQNCCNVLCISAISRFKYLRPKRSRIMIF